ncbi:hypothetical protein D777_02030 [Marinobacter nitratireducens]|uniref:Uncharacterized protein n=1 Tax=Marinobacter nitratireducens TaxID=1137280 RepID=A0A072N2H2_9GAMM|nr:hypothetical protein D777_02030 [Marinobacter nitratireducens]
MAFRTEPLFAYRFKNRLNPQSKKSEIQAFLDDLLAAEDDDFLMQRHHVQSGAYPDFRKVDAGFLAYKTSRHHELLDTFLSSGLDIHVIGIVRHPCGAINSWIHSQKEFHKKGCVVAQDWKSGACRKDGVGEYWGFEDWVSTTHHFLDLESRYSEFSLVKYSDLVRQPTEISKAIFDKAGLSWCEQTEEFLCNSQREHNADPYAVFKDRSVNDRWMSELQPDLIDEILKRVRSEGLDRFLE